MSMKVLVVGGAGYFGRLLIEDLQQRADCQIVIGGRNFQTLERARREIGVHLEIRSMDLLRPETLVDGVKDVGLAICTAGPFQSLPVTLAQLCIRRGIHYVDLADDRDFVRRVRALATSACLPAVCSGWSAVPALSAALTRIAAQGMEKVDSVFIQISPGNRFPRAHGTVASLLASIGKQFTVWRDGRWNEATGWSAPRDFSFPAPVGRRTGYVVDVADHELFPELFGAKRVEFRVGSELPVLNGAVSLLAWAVRRGLVSNLPRWTPVLRRGMAVVSFLGHDWGAVGVEVAGGGVRRRACVVADKYGQRIPTMPAAVISAALITGKTEYHGLVPLDCWISRDQLRNECERRGFRLVIEEENE